MDQLEACESYLTLVPENGVHHAVKLGKFWLLVSHGILYEKGPLLNIVTGKNQGGSYWLWIMLYSWLNMFPGPLKRAVHCVCWSEGRAVTWTWKGLTACGRVWHAWEERHADHLHGMENRNCSYMRIERTHYASCGLFQSIEIRHTFLGNLFNSANNCTLIKDHDKEFLFLIKIFSIYK